MKLELKSVSKTYGSKKALQEMNLTFTSGVTGLLGSNGAGKSTLMRLMATIETPTEGTIFYNGKDIAKNPDMLRKELGYLPQDFGVYPNMTPVEFLEYMAAMKGLSKASARKRIDVLLEDLHLTEARKRKLGGFSGGMKQRVGIAQALLNDPSVLIVDEPTVGLDPEERIAFRNLLASLSEEKIILLSTHIVTDIEAIAPRIVLLNQGRLLADLPPEELIQKVEGMVWNCVIPAEKIEEFGEKYKISNAIQRSNGIHARVISKKQPTINAEAVAPDLEDSYLWFITKKEA